MLTIFTTPKPFVGDTGDRQERAIRSWLQITPDVFVFGEENDRNRIEQMGAKFDDQYHTNDRGTPYVNSIFERARALAHYPTLMYVNADIALLERPSGLCTISTLKGHFLCIGQRIDVDMPKVLPGEPDWKRHYMQCVGENGTLVDPTGKDYFILPRDHDLEIPPYLVGRLMWDTAFVRLAYNKGYDLYDTTPCITALHFRHGYDHLPGGQQEYATGEEAKRNYQLAERSEIEGHITDAPRVINFDGEIINRDVYEVSQAYTTADIATKQRQLVNQQLALMHNGNAPPHFASLGNLLRSIRTSEQMSLLDAASSSAYYNEIIRYYVPGWVTYTGIDYNPGMVKLARDTYPDITALWADIRDLTLFADQEFDIVLSGATIMHIREWQYAVKELTRVAKRWLILHRTWVYPNQSPTRTWIQDAYGQKAWYTVFNEQELCNLVYSQGFVHRRTMPSGESSGDNWVNVTYLFERDT